MMLALAGLTSARRVSAHEQASPVPGPQPRAAWPDGKPAAHDVIVPVILIVGPDGRVTSAEVEASLDARFDAAALDVAREWTFRPALRDDKPVAARVRAVVRFVGEHEAAPEAAAPPVTTAPAVSAPPADVTPAPAPEASHVTVTGQRAPPPPRSASEVTVERPILAASPHRTASDLLLTVPGMALTQHSGEGAAHQIFFRGFDAVHGQDLEIWAGGAPVNDVSNIHGQGYADLNFLPPEVVKRIRSSPGSYDPRQGDFAVAGSVWLDLGYDEPGITAKASTGQFNTRRYFLGYHPKDASDATFAAFELYSTDGFGPSRAARRTSLVAQTEYRIGDATARIMASTYSARFDSAGVLRLDDIQQGRIDRLGSYDEKQGGDSARSQVVLDLSHGDSVARWSIAPYVVFRSMRLRQDYTGYLVTPFTGTAAQVAAANAASAQGNSEQQINDATTLGMTGSYHRHFPIFAANDSLEAGVSARYDRIEQSQRKLSIQTSEVTLGEVDARINATDVAGYLDAALHPIPRVTVRGGLRIDGLAYATEDDAGAGGQRRAAQGAHLGAKGTADVLVVPGLRAVVSYGDGFRSPQARSLQEGENAPFTKVQSYEAGLRYQTAQIRTTASVFRTVLSDDLAFNQVTARNERTPPTRRTGVTVEMSTQPAPWFDAAASFTFTRAEFTNTDGGYAAGDLLPYAPQVVARTDAAFTPTLGHVLNRAVTGRFGLGGTGVARRPLPYAELGHDYFLVDALASVRIKEIELGVSAFNLLDLDWYDGEYTFASSFQRGQNRSLVPERHVTVGPPRTVMATLSLYL
ncbi:MAG: Outer rane receptor protein [Labilithrix sp.]|nr:Outer rane receptor protein [Labilithrix sp.]